MPVLAEKVIRSHLTCYKFSLCARLQLDATSCLHLAIVLALGALQEYGAEMRLRLLLK